MPDTHVLKTVPANTAYFKLTHNKTILAVTSYGAEAPAYSYQ